MKAFTLILFVLLFSITANSQNDTLKLSLDEAQKYALENNADLKNAQLDILSAKRKIWETTAIGLPHVNGSYSYQYIPGTIPTIQFDTMAPPFPIAARNSASYDITVSQLIFSGEYIVGLQATRTYKLLSQLSYEKSEMEVKEDVEQGYFSVLVLKQNKSLLDSSVNNLEDLYNETKALVSTGFLESTNADQIQVSLNSVRNARDIIETQLQMLIRLLKIQIGIPIDQQILLTNTIEEILKINDCTNVMDLAFSVQENVDFKMVETQEKMMKLGLKREKSTFLPTVSGFYLYQDKTNKALLDFTINNIVGINVNVPIFASGQKLAKVSQAKIELDKTQNTKRVVSETLIMQYELAKSNLKNALDKYDSQKENVDLSNRIYRNTMEKYRLGMSSSMEVTQAHSQYLEINSNYTNTMLALINARLELEKLLSK